MKNFKAIYLYILILVIIAIVIGQTKCLQPIDNSIMYKDKIRHLHNVVKSVEKEKDSLKIVIMSYDTILKKLETEKERIDGLQVRLREQLNRKQNDFRTKQREIRENSTRDSVYIFYYKYVSLTDRYFADSTERKHK